MWGNQRLMSRKNEPPPAQKIGLCTRSLQQKSLADLMVMVLVALRLLRYICHSQSQAFGYLVFDGRPIIP
jgi:hypothetical protein